MRPSSIPVKIIWCNSLNIGDTITPYIALQEGCSPVLAEDENDTTFKILGCGSILNWNRQNTHIWGAGIATRETFTLKKDVTASLVRGPISEEMLVASGFKGNVAWGDPALLMVDYYWPKHSKTTKLGVIPHYVDIEEATRIFGPYTVIGDVKILNVFQPIEHFIDELLDCDMVISSSLHGIILADTYGVDNAQAVFTDKIGGDGTKYRDYFESVGRDDGPIKIERVTHRGALKDLREGVLPVTVERKLHIAKRRAAVRETNPFRTIRQRGAIALMASSYGCENENTPAGRESSEETPV